MSQNSVVISAKGTAPLIFAIMSRPYDSMKREHEKMRNLWRADASIPERVVEARLPLCQAKSRTTRQSNRIMGPCRQPREQLGISPGLQ
jgi:hypothetical protein